LVLMSLMVPGDLIHVPGGVHYNVTAGADESMKLAVLYSPPHYVNRIVHLTKDDSMAAEAEAEALQFREAHRVYAKTRSRFFATERV
jgi:hypothetical protein